MLSSRLQCWAIILSAYTCKVKHKPSKQHGNADGLSRLPLDLEFDPEWTNTTEDTVCVPEQQQLNHAVTY